MYSRTHIKLAAIATIALLGYLLSHPDRDLSLFNAKGVDEFISRGQFYLYDPSNDKDWFPTGHYRGQGPLLVEKQVIVHKGQESPIEQAAMARFREGGHIEAHNHKTAVESFTGIKGRCLFEIINEGGSKVVVLVEKGIHLILSPGTVHSVRNDEEEDCMMITTLVAVGEDSLKHRVFAKKKKNSYFIQSQSLAANDQMNGATTQTQQRRRRLR